MLAGEVALCERGQQCKICEGDNCNGKLNFQSCYSCDTSTNPICGAMSSLTDVPKKTCADYLDDCVTYFSKLEVFYLQSLILLLPHHEQTMAWSTVAAMEMRISRVHRDPAPFARTVIVTHNPQSLPVPCLATSVTQLRTPPVITIRPLHRPPIVPTPSSLVVRTSVTSTMTAKRSAVDVSTTLRLKCK